MEERIKKEIGVLQGKMEAHAKYLDENAELGFELEKTSEYVRNELSKIGIVPKNCGRCGVVGEIEGEKVGRKKCFLLRADMDALSGIYPNDSKKIKHACGHHFHTAMLLGAAECLYKTKKEFCGSVRLMFQGAEEILEGARDMIENGVLDAPEPSGAMMLHVLSGIEMQMGQIIVAKGGISAPEAAFFEISVEGRGTHGAMAYMGVDAISVGAYIIIALHEISAREIPFGTAAAISVGKIEGGKTANVIPDKVNISGSLRSLDGETAGKIKTRICEICDNIAKAFGARATVTFSHICPSLLNDSKLSENVFESMVKLFGKEKVMLAGEGKSKGIGGGSDDFAYISQKVPSLIVSMCAGSRSDGYVYPLHNPNVAFDNRALSVGASVYAAAALGFLRE